jgi:hypothetical protein
MALANDTVSQYLCLMRNITLSIDDAVYARSRVIAAEKGTSLSGLVREYLEGLTEERTRREQARRDILAMIGSFGGEVGTMPSREARHARR